MSSINDKSWSVRNGILCVESSNGIVTPTAEEIYAAIFENSYSFAVTENDAYQLSRSFKFSKYPVELQLRIEAASEQGACLYVRLYAALEGYPSQFLPDDFHTDHLILGDTWFPIQPGQKAELLSALQAAGIDHPGPIHLNQYTALIRLKSRLVRVDPDIKQGAFAGGRLKSQPEGLQANLYPYQQKGWQWLSFVSLENAGGILADEMGLGKTLQVIALLLSERDHSATSSLVIAPGSLLENWKREVERFAPTLSVHVHHGLERTGYPDALNTYDLVISSYDTIARDLSLINQVKWNIVICDEAQAIKNPLAKRTITVKKIPRRIGFAVSGTPVENSLTDLWSIMDFCLPGFLGTLQAFQREFESTNAGAQSLEPLISPFILRRTVREVANDLPPKIIIPQILSLSSEEAQLYEQIREHAVREFSNNASLVALVRLRMFCTHPFLLYPQQSDPAEISTKYLRLIEIIEEIVNNGAKALIFTSFNMMNDILRGDLGTRFEVPVWSIDGRTAIVARQGILDEFSATQGAAILVLNPQAAGTGLNITAANHVIHFNPEWNPAREDQASARAHRRGQDRPVTIHRLIYANTVEETIDERLTRKREIASSAVVGIQGEREDYGDLIKAIQISPIQQL